MPTRLIDLSHEIEAGMTTYPGLPGPIIVDHLSREASRGHYAGGTTFQIGRIELVANTGTYLDAPFHRYAEGSDLAALPLDRLADLSGVVIDATGIDGRVIQPELLADHDLHGRAVLIRTGWDRHWRTTQYGEGHPYLNREAAEHLIAVGAILVGIDSLNIDDTRDGERPVHTRLLGSGIPIVEHLCRLGELPPQGFRFHCAPAPFRGVGSFPVRAYAIVE
jgi:arylformamidase